MSLSKDELQKLIQLEFADVQRPAETNIAVGTCAHQCYEEAFEAFQSVDPSDLSAMEDLSEHTSFLTKDAFHFVFPLMMLATFIDSDSPTMIFNSIHVLALLTHNPSELEEMFGNFSQGQRYAMKEYLNYVLEQDAQMMMSQKAMDKRVSFWEEFGRKPPQ